MAGTLHTEDQMTSAWRVVSTIGTVKWVLVALYVLVIVVTLMGAMLGDADGRTTFTMIAVSALAAAITWVMFGFAQHTLGMLILIARNTGRH